MPTNLPGKATVHPISKGRCLSSAELYIRMIQDITSRSISGVTATLTSANTPAGPISGPQECHGTRTRIKRISRDRAAEIKVDIEEIGGRDENSSNTKLTLRVSLRSSFDDAL